MDQKISKPQKKPFTDQVPSPSLPEGFKWIEDRAFSEEGNPAYPLPNDNPEFTRLNLQHYQVRFLLHGLHMAPVHETLKRGGARVLDAGCGTGIWSIEMAQKYPESEFVASDLINVFTQSVTKAPPNLRFDLSNTLELPYSDGQFDYVFQRFQAVCFKEEEWPRVIKELTRVLKPGGWLELIDTDGLTKSSGPQTLKTYSLVQEFLKMRGINTKYVHNLDETIRAEGLIDIAKDHRSVPLGWGPKEIAIPAAENIAIAMKSFGPQVTTALGVDQNEYDEMVTEAPQEFVIYRTYWDFWYFYGRKPGPEY